MLIPKNKKYKSVRKIKVNPTRKLIRSLQIGCYKGHFPMQCNNCIWSVSCWFCGLKPKE